MSDTLFSWVAFIGFITWIIPWFFSSSQGEYLQFPVSALIETKLKHIFRSLFIFIGISCALLMLYQGFHLLSHGWDPWDQNNVDPSVIGRNAARSRGRGGILILLMTFFPQFLIGSSIYTLFKGRKLIKDHLIIVSRLLWYIKLFTQKEIISDEDRKKDEYYSKELEFMDEWGDDYDYFLKLQDLHLEGSDNFHDLFDEEGKISPITPQERKYFQNRWLLKKRAQASYSRFFKNVR
tara:strand:+ start:789 stop:1496 length:708 start_codon:yes stop_codon:yes gene_type:complete